MGKENTTHTKYKRDGRYSTYEAAVKAECPQIEEPIAEIYLERISALKPTNPLGANQKYVRPRTLKKRKNDSKIRLKILLDFCW